MEHKYFFRFILFLACFPILQGSAKNNTTLETFIRQVSEHNKFTQVDNIWQPDNTFDKTAMLEKVENAVPLTIDYSNVATLIQKNSTAISLVIPGFDGNTYTINLAQYKFLSNDFEVHVKGAGNSDALFNYTPGLYYSGTVSGIPGSVASFSFFNNEVYGIFSIPGVGNFNVVPNVMVGKYYNYNTHYILYNDKDLKIKDHGPNCATDQLPMQHRDAEKTTTTLNNNIYNNCTEVNVFEVGDYALYVTKGHSVTNVTNYLTALFNNQSTLYRNEGILIDLKYLQVDSVVDAWNSIASASSVLFLDKFGYVTGNTLHGCDLAILASTCLNGGYGALGGVAWLQAMCQTYHASDSFGSYAFCDMDNSAVTNFPTFSWDVEVITHEMGHIVGSPHTHRCCWNPPGSGTTAIDACYTLEGSCATPTPAYPLGGGTIMSYCHLTSDGINFSNGFGQQPGDTVRYYLAHHFSATCGSTYRPSTALATANRTITANRECTDMTSGFTYYWKDNNTASQSDDTLLLMIKKNGNTIGDLNTSGFSVTANTIANYGSGVGDTISFPAGIVGILGRNYGMRRYWKIATTTTPTTAVEVYFPFLQADTTDVDGSVPGLAPLSGYQMYWVNNPINPSPTSSFSGATAANFSIYNFSATTASTTTWKDTTVGSTYFAAMKMVNLSGGGTGFYSDCVTLPAPTAGTTATLPCTGSTNAYSVGGVAGATSYSWTVSGAGWSGTGTTTSANLVTGSVTGTITVTAIDSCGSGAPYTITVDPSPLPAETISTFGTICASSPTAVFNATATGSPVSYSWTVLGTGWSGSGTGASITATVGSGAGTIIVNGTNACGTGPNDTLVIMPNAGPTAAPGPIMSPTLTCTSATGVFSITPVTGATGYNWTVSGTGWSGSGTTTSVTATIGSGTGTIMITSSDSCGVSPSETLTVTPSTVPAAATSISGPSALCSGSTVTYSTPAIPGATSYTWSVSGTGWSGTSATNTITVTVGAGTGTITVAGVDACGAGASFTLGSLTPGVTPVASFTESAHITPDHTNITVTNSGTSGSGAIYSWDFGGGVPGSAAGAGPFNVHWNTPGTYTVTLTVTNGGCSATYTDTVHVYSGVGLTKVIDKALTMDVTPNPSNGSFDIIFNDAVSAQITVRLSDIQGRMVYSQEFTGTTDNKLSVVTSGLPSGSYNVSVICNGNIINKKVIITGK